MASIGAKSLNDQALPTIPVMHTIPPSWAQLKESFRVVVPMSSRILLKPRGYFSTTTGAMAPVSMMTPSAPFFLFFNPLLLQVDTPVINFVIDPVAAPSPSDKCHTHEREAFRDLTRLVNVTYFLDFPNDATDCHGKDPQNPRPVKAEVVPNLPGFFVRAFALGSNKHLLAALYFFGGHAVDCMAAVIVASD